MKPFVIRDTSKYGKGCFAKRHIRSGETIHVMHGKTISLSDMVALVTSGKEAIDDPLQVGRRTYIDLDETSRSFNHSCEPNAGIRERNTLVAIRDIKPEDEITYDYSLTIAPTTWKMRCGCGSTHCRRILGDVRTIPRSTIRTYLRSGAIQRYMRRILPDILKGTYRIPAYEKRALALLGTHSYHV